jgi:hypothetical protein
MVPRGGTELAHTFKDMRCLPRLRRTLTLKSFPAPCLSAPPKVGHVARITSAVPRRAGPISGCSRLRSRPRLTGLTARLTPSLHRKLIERIPYRRFERADNAGRSKYQADRLSTNARTCERTVMSGGRPSGFGRNPLFSMIFTHRRGAL